MSSLRRDRKDYIKMYSTQENGRGHHAPCVMAGEHKPLKDRLQNINVAMVWIKDELVELKESDRTLMKIFKKLEGDVSDLTDMLSWRLSSSPNYKHNSMRPQSMESYSNLEFVSHDQTDAREGSQELEGTLTSSKEELADPTHLKPSTSTNGSDSLFSPNEGSPCPNAKHPSNGSPTLKGSASLNKIANSPSIQRIQDDSSSNISRNSSIDSGIQFEHEHTASESAVVAPTPAAAASTDTSDGLGTSFANDIFKSLGFS